MKSLRRLLLVLALTVGASACNSTLLGPHNPDAGSHNPDAGSHNPDAGSHNPDAGSHNPDAGS
jgi:PTS system glucitol/sorbitol-specific IIC component